MRIGGRARRKHETPMHAARRQASTWGQRGKRRDEPQERQARRITSPAEANRTSHGGRRKSSPVGSPPHDTPSGAKNETTRGEQRKGEARTTGDIAGRQASKSPRPMTSPMTSPERTRHEQQGKPSRGAERKKTKPITSPTRKASKKSQLNRIIPEEMLNSGVNRKYTKMTGNETPQSKQ